jgi:predicted RNA binding protein YcfA (HicA-like mRNA interferase family)
VQALALRVITERLESQEPGARASGAPFSSRLGCGEPVANSESGLVLAALLRLGWTVKRQSGSHRTLSREGWPGCVFAFHDSEEIGPRMLARIARRRSCTLAVRDKSRSLVATLALRSSG